MNTRVMDRQAGSSGSQVTPGVLPCHIASESNIAVGALVITSTFQIEGRREGVLPFKDASWKSYTILLFIPTLAVRTIVKYTLSVGILASDNVRNQRKTHKTILTLLLMGSGSG